MKLPRQLTKRQLVKIVEEIRNWLYMDEDTLQNIGDFHSSKLAEKLEREDPRRKLYEFVNPNKDWDSAADIISGIADVLKDHNLVPTKFMTAEKAYRKPTPNENWKDDAVQFPRLLDELQGIGVINLVGETEWLCLEAEMDLPREKIMQIFGRAQKEWDRIKKETR